MESAGIVENLLDSAHKSVCVFFQYLWKCFEDAKPASRMKRSTRYLAILGTDEVTPAQAPGSFPGAVKPSRKTSAGSFCLRIVPVQKLLSSWLKAGVLAYAYLMEGKTRSSSQDPKAVLHAAPKAD